MIRKKRILILGGTRFCGRELARILVSNGSDVTVSSRREGGAPKGTTFHAGERKQTLEELAQQPAFDLVYDFTAYNDQDVSQALKIFPQSNYFFISSTWVKKNLQDEMLDVTKKYINNKTTAEKVVIEAHSKGRKAFVVRLPVLMGQDDHTGRLDFYRQRIQDGQGILLINGGTNKFEVASNLDIANALSKLADKSSDELPVLMEARINEVISVKELVERLSGLENTELRIVSVTKKEIDNLLPEYLLNEPFYREEKLVAEGENLFELVSVSPRSISLWLKELVSSPVVIPQSDNLREKENKFISASGAGYESYWPVISLLESVGKQLVEWRNDKAAREVHSKDGFKTEADRKSHLILLNGLNKLYPNIPVISEEDSSGHNARPKLYWLIDPIDGTASWYGGFEGFVSQLALIENDQVIFGAIHAPVLKKTWMGLVNNPSFLNGKVLEKLKVTDRLVLVDNYPEPKGIAAKLFKKLPANKYLESGSLGLKGALVADGSADVFVKDVVVRDWDMAPVIPILSGVGGYITLVDGSPYECRGSFEKKTGVIVARDMSLVKKIVSIISKEEIE